MLWGRSLGSIPALLALGAACAGRSELPPPVEMPRVLTAPPQSVDLRPGATKSVPFVLATLDGAPVAGATVLFAIVDNPDTPGAEARGATLSNASATTDAMGVAAARVTSGLNTVFRVRATSGAAEAEAEVVVGPEDSGSVDVAPFFAPGARAAALATSAEVLFFDDSACADIPLRRPPVPGRTERKLPPEGGVARFDFVAIMASHAILARARDGHGAVLALGCVDLPGATLVTEGTVQVAVRLADSSPDPVGHYAVTSDFALQPAPTAVAALAAPWRDLGDCPLDPAQLWLDCTVDALAGAAPADPVDCVPAAAAGGEGALGDALAARRGTYLPGPDGAATACRGARTSGGAVSVDAVLLGLYGSPMPPAVVALGAIADDAVRLLDGITVRSELDVRPSTREGVYQVTHTLGDVVFNAREVRKEVPLLPLALPALSAVTTGTLRDDWLLIDTHGVTLRLGSAARIAFGTLGLAQRALPGDAASFVDALAALARSEDGTKTGCAALDAALCAEVGRAAGCLAAACTAGLAALARRLDAGFDAADGAGLDFYLAGSAPLFDRHGNGFADRVGDVEAAPPQPGTWSADLRTQAGRSLISGQWQAVRTGN